MRNMIILLLFGCLAAQAFSRPASADDATDSEGDEADYEVGSEEVDADENAQNDDEPRLGDQFPGYKSDRRNEFEDEAIEEPNSNNEYKLFKKHRVPSKYIEKNDVNEQPDPEQQCLLDRDDNNLRALRNDKTPLKKRTPSSISVSNEDRDEMIQNERDEREKIDKREYQNEPLDISDEAQHSKKFYSSVQNNNNKNFDYRLNYNRDRRGVDDNETFATPKVDDTEVAVTENEEEAIKRHVKKLSGEEFEELLSSLTEDKRELLKKIMESGTGIENEVNKREITKKAGADENGFVESGHSDTSKLQEGSVVADSNVQAPSTETSKQSNPQSEITILPVTNKPSESSNVTFTSMNVENKPELSLQDNELSPEKSDSGLSTPSTNVDANNQAKINLQEPPKTDSKRDIGLETPSETSVADAKLNKDTSLNDPQNDLQNESGDFISQDDGLSQVADDESEIANNNENNNNVMMKREALMDKYLADSVKSLEESFPNSNSYDDDDPYSGSDMAPLVRVKRKNSDLSIKKRAAALLPDAKVAYFPYRSENDDEDNDEGNEFDDDGFYDRTSNIEKNNIKNKMEDEALNSFEDSKHRTITSNENAESNINNLSKSSQSNNANSDTMSLGSDTDSVLSGVEGVDDNLMLNAGSRNRREADTKTDDQIVDQADDKNRVMRSTPVTEDEEKAVSETFMNAPNYHESDAFGPLPRSYDGELGRYKRIRRVKQPPAQQDISSANT